MATADRWCATLAGSWHQSRTRAMMNHLLENAQSTAAAKIQEAEEADFLCFLENVKADVGNEVGTFLDSMCAYWLHGDEIDPIKRGNIGRDQVCAVFRFPGCTEIVARYCRKRPPNQAQDYRIFEWGRFV